MPNDCEQTRTLEADVAEPTPEIVRRGGTFESFSHRSFTWFWSGALVSNTGTWMQNAALAIVVYSLRKSELDLGLVNFVSGIPVLFLALPGGVLADRSNKRMLLIWAQALLGVQAAALWFLHLTGRLAPEHSVAALVWISALGLVGGVISALTFPAWQSFLPDLVPRERLMNAIALNAAQFQSSRLLGPLAASALFALGASAGDVFLVNAASFLFVIAALWAIRPSEDCRPEPRAARAEGPWATLTAGVRYARENRAIGTLIISAAVLSVFALPYMMLLPAIADKVLHGANGGKLAYAWLLAANGFGAVIGSLGVASLPQTARRHRIIPASLGIMALVLIAFSQSHQLWLSMLLSVLGGVAFLTTNSLINTSLQASTPGHLRGRVMSLFVMAFMGLIPVSAGVFGPLGQWIGPGNAVMVGAVLVATWSAFLFASRWLEPSAQPAAEKGA